MTHTGSDGANAGERIAAAGYSCGRGPRTSPPASRRGVGDGRLDEQRQGHRENILDPRYTDIGVGLAYSAERRRPYWTQDFAAG